MIKTDFKGVARELNKINRKIAKMEDIATTRSLNIILDQQRREIANDVSEEYGLLKGSAKAHITPKKATRVDKEIKLDVHSLRVNLVQAKSIKGGISFRKKGGGRVKIKVAVKSGSSKPFMIKAKIGGQAGGENIKTVGGVKKVPVYVPERFNKFTDIFKRKVTTLKGSSLARMVETMEIESKDLAKALKEKFPSIYKKQLEKAKFTGSK